MTLPFAAGDLPGIGGRIKDGPSDFVVEEVALYELAFTTNDLDFANVLNQGTAAICKVDCARSRVVPRL